MLLSTFAAFSYYLIASLATARSTGASAQAIANDPAHNTEQYLRYSLKIPVDHHLNGNTDAELESHAFLNFSYMVNSGNYQSGGPVFLFLEGERFPGDHNQHLDILNGLTEAHQGASVVFESICSDNTFQNLQSSINQHVLAHATYFAHHVSFPGLEHLKLTPKHVPWIVYGSSTSDTTAADLYKKHAETFWGAISPSAGTERICLSSEHNEARESCQPAACAQPTKLLFGNSNPVLVYCNSTLLPEETKQVHETIDKTVELWLKDWNTIHGNHISQYTRSSRTRHECNCGAAFCAVDQCPYYYRQTPPILRKQYPLAKRAGDEKCGYSDCDCHDETRTDSAGKVITTNICICDNWNAYSKTCIEGGAPHGDNDDSCSIICYGKLGDPPVSEPSSSQPDRGDDDDDDCGYTDCGYSDCDCHDKTGADSSGTIITTTICTCDKGNACRKTCFDHEDCSIACYGKVNDTETSAVSNQDKLKVSKRAREDDDCGYTDCDCKGGLSDNGATANFCSCSEGRYANICTKSNDCKLACWLYDNETASSSSPGPMMQTPFPPSGGPDCPDTRCKSENQSSVNILPRPNHDTPCGCTNCSISERCDEAGCDPYYECSDNCIYLMVCREGDPYVPPVANETCQYFCDYDPIHGLAILNDQPVERLPCGCADCTCATKCNARECRTSCVCTGFGGCRYTMVCPLDGGPCRYICGL